MKHSTFVPGGPRVAGLVLVGVAGAGLVGLGVAGCASESPADAAIERDAAPELDALEPTDAARCAALADASVQGPDGETIDLRGVRYCEVLVARLGDGGIAADVYNTLGLTDCPDAEWSALDADSIARSEGAAAVVLNGPRYWLIDAFESSSFIDPTVRTFGCLPMRLAGRVQVMGGASTPYVTRSVMRATTYVFHDGARVYELIDDAGATYVMQSYSVQIDAQDEASLENLAARLTLPEGWTFLSRVLDAELRVTAVDGVATIVQDELANTYQLVAL